jgi:uncharacterized protein YecE (DUF72 family)
MEVPVSLFIGTSGWNYDSWRHSFYAGSPKSQWLAHCAARFSAIEVNATFYRLQNGPTFERWAAQTPPRFRFAIKGSRYLTHQRKLIDPAPSIVMQRDVAVGLGHKLAAVVWQLPRRFHRNTERLEQFARALQDQWPGTRHAIEFRHDSWFADDIEACLREHGIANCQSDAADWPLWDAVTTDLVYVRLHGHTVTYVSGYTDEELRAWARRTRRWVREGRDVHVYFDNDAHGHAPHDATRLIDMLESPKRGPRSASARSRAATSERRP